MLDRGELTFHIPREKLTEVMQALRDDALLRFEFCASVSGVNYPDDAGAELHVAYHLQSMTHNRRLRVEVSCPDADPHVPSVVAIYPRPTGTSVRPGTCSGSSSTATRTSPAS